VDERSFLTRARVSIDHISIAPPSPCRCRWSEHADMREFDHERLDVYVAAVEMRWFPHLPRGRAYLADRLQRAATSMPSNIVRRTVESDTGTGTGTGTKRE